MKECNFAFQMENVSRIFLFLIVLLIPASNLFSHSGKAHYSSIEGEDVSIFEENGKVGIKNQRGEVLIPAVHEAIGWSDGHFSIIDNVTGYRNKGKWGLIDLQNHKITKAEFEDLSPGEGVIIVARKKLPGTVRIVSGCISTSGKQIIPFQYDGLRISSFRAIVYQRNGAQFKHGLIDLNNNVIIPLSYQNIFPLGSLRYGVEDFENKTAIFSEDGKQMTGFLIDSLSSFKKDFAIIYQDQSAGLINRNGQIVIEPRYREIVINDDASVNIRESDSWLFLDGKNNLLKQTNADSLVIINKELLSVFSNGKVRLSDQNFKPVTGGIFSALGKYNNGRAVARINHHAGIVNERGEFIIKPLYHDLIIDEKFIRANLTSNNRRGWVVLDMTGNRIGVKIYDYIAEWNGKFFPVQSRGYWGAMDATGKEIVACVHDELLQQMHRRIVVKFKGAYGIINLDEDWILTPQPHLPELLNDSLYLLRTPKTTFLKSYKGEVIYFSDNKLEIKPDHFIEHLSSGAVWKIDFTGVIADRYALPENVESMSRESEGLTAIKKDGRYGFIDDRGRLRIANRYEGVKDFSSGMAAVMILGRWGFINHREQLIIQPVYDEVVPFKGNFALVKQNGLYGIVDTNGKLVLPVRYDSISILDGERFQIQQNGLWGLAGSNGRIITNPKYDYLEDLNNGYVIVARDGKFGLLTLQGVSTIPQLYDHLRYDPQNGQYIGLKKAEWEVKRF